MKHADAEILTVDDLAALFACDKETAAARLNSGDLPGVKVGRGWIIPRQALFERLNEKAREEAADRRSRQAAMLNAAEGLENSAQNATKNISTTPKAVLHINIEGKKGGRKRREPPPLPTLPI